MAEPITCPICGSPIALGSHECPRCGFKLAGVTQQFQIPGTGQPTQEFHPITGEPVQTGRVSDPALRVVKGPQTDELFYLDRPTITLGRDPHCDIFLNDMTVSRHHAEITLAPGQATLVDKGSLNGTWVDGKVCAEAVLHDGSIIQIGTFVMMFQEHPTK